MAKVFGIVSSTLPTGITGQVIGDASITGDVGDTKDLVGNPSSTIAESRAGTPNIRKMSINFAFATGEGAKVADYALLGASTTLLVTSEDTDAITLTGICTHWEVKAEKDNWWTGTITVEKKGADA